MGRSQLLLGSLSVGCTDHQAKSTCRGGGRSRQYTDSLHHSLGGEGRVSHLTEEVSAGRRLCPGPSCLCTLQRLHLGGGGLKTSRCKAREQDLSPPATWGEDPELRLAEASPDPWLLDAPNRETPQTWA